jgi:very-short-patch-repair endonuclease
MKPLPRQLIALARHRSGLVTAKELTEHRVVGRTRQEMFETGTLVTVHRGVYRLSSHPETFHQRCHAACLAAPNASISGPTAGRLWQLRKVYTDEIHVIARHAIHLEGVTAHRTDLLGPGDSIVRNGIRTLRPARLLCDLASHLDESNLESVLEQMLDRGMLSIQSARSAAKRFVAPGRPGSLRIGRVLDGRADWLKPADSDLELRVWRSLSARGIRLGRQHPVLLDSGVTVHLDLAAPEILFAVEVDHVTWHGGRLDAQRDKRRDRELARLGWTVVRVTDEDIRVRFDETINELVDIATRCATRNS